MTIGAAGTLAGVALGCAIAVSIPWVMPAIEQLLGIRFLTPSVYFPVRCRRSSRRPT